MYKENENKEYGDKLYNNMSAQDLSPDRNILAYNPYVNNQTPIKPFSTEDVKEVERFSVGMSKRTSSPQPRQHYAPVPTVIHYPRQITTQDGEVKRIEKVWVQNENIPHEEKEKIINGLKEYFEVVLKGLTDQMNFELRRRDEDIKKLEKRLNDNENEILGKEREIAKLKDNQVEAINHNLNKMAHDKASTKGKGVQELQRNFEYLSGRIRDIDGKVKQVIESFAANAKHAKTLSKIEEKVGGFLEDFLKIETKKMYGLNLRMFEFFSSKDSLLVALERQVQSTKEVLIADNSPSKVNMTVYDQKLSSLKRELEGLQSTIQYIGDRQSKSQFDPVKLERLEREMAKLQQKGNSENYAIRRDKVEECQKQYKTVLARINKVYGQMHSKKSQGDGHQRVAGHLKTTPKKQPKYQRQRQQNTVRQPQFERPEIKPFKHKRISAPQQPHSTNNALYFSHHDSNSDVEHFNQSDDEPVSKGKMNQKLLRLIQIIRTNRKSMPLRIVVDETGYLKEKETGAYLFDRNGVLFELEDDELDDAVKNRIIRI